MSCSRPGTSKKECPKVHSEPFAFKEPETWGTPADLIELDEPYWGKMHLKRRQQLHEKKSVDVPYDVIRVCFHQEREQPLKAIWLAWLAPCQFLAGITVTVETIWRAFVSRWTVEPGIHVRKETLGCTMPRFQTQEAGDGWTELTAIACWIIFKAHSIVADTLLLWQKPQQHLTTQRVQQSVHPIFALIRSPARAPKMRGKAPGWLKGKQRKQKLRYAVVKKTPVAAKTA